MLIKWLILYFLLALRNGNLAEKELIFEREQQRECEKKLFPQIRWWWWRRCEEGKKYY